MPLMIPMPADADGNGISQPPVKRWMLIVGPVLLFLSALNYLTMFFQAPRFVELFAGFGADLPMLTGIVLTTSPYFGVLILIGLVPCIKLFNTSDGARASKSLMWIAAGFGASLILLGIWVTAMYLPIFQMGSVV